MKLFNLSTELTKKEKTKQKEKETTTATNLKFYKLCVDKKEQFRERLKNIELTKKETENEKKKNLPFLVYKLTNFVKFIRRITK